MKLSKWAEKQGIGYRAAWEQYHKGMIPNAYRLETGTIIVPETDLLEKVEDYTVVYARVSSSENTNNLISQSERVMAYCVKRGWNIKEVVKECASGLNDKRPKLTKLLKNKGVTRIVVEHKDRLTRFGFEYIKNLFQGEIVVINEVDEGESEIMEDFISIITSFCARIYGHRRSKRRTEKLIKVLESLNVER